MEESILLLWCFWWCLYATTHQNIISKGASISRGRALGQKELDWSE